VFHSRTEQLPSKLSGALMLDRMTSTDSSSGGRFFHRPFPGSSDGDGRSFADIAVERVGVTKEP